MTLPDGDKIPLDVVAERWSKLSGERVTLERLFFWHDSELLEIQTSPVFPRFRGTVDEVCRLELVAAMKGDYEIETWITGEEAARFEREHLAAALQPSSAEGATKHLIRKFLRYADQNGQPGSRHDLQAWLSEHYADPMTKDGYVVWEDEAGAPHKAKLKTLLNTISSERNACKRR
jgi:hypothetical protein